MNEMALSCKNVTKKFFIFDQGISWRIIFGRLPTNTNTFTALNNVTLEVPKGKFVGILGRNGAGKSTLLRTLAGVYKPDDGVVCVSGPLSCLFELGGFGDTQITGLEYSERFLQFYGVNKSKIKVLLNEICDFSELNDYFYKKIYAYSAGMKARLYFAAATALEFDIYLVDEILSVGDEHFQAKCWQRLRKRFAKGSSGILVTHDWSATLKLCEETHIFDHGKIIFSGKTDKVVQHYLNLPKPTGEIAKFHVNENTKLTASSGKDTQFTFDLILNKSVPVSFNYTVEMLNLGVGWEILLLNKTFTYLTSQAGKHTVLLKIPKLPLYAGRYYLNLFLQSPDPEVDPMQLDARSWTYGNGLELIVLGEQSRAVSKLPWKWEHKELTYA